VDNGNIYNFSSSDWTRSFTASVSAHNTAFRLVGISARVSGVLRLDEADDEAGAALRGIMNRDVSADYALYLNAELPLRVISFKPSKWLKVGWLRVFDFEQHWSPFVDIGIVRDRERLRSFSIDDALVAGGLEVVTFPSFMRSLYLRISAGFDLRSAWETKKRPSLGDAEIFIGLNHHF